ncbi:thioredoxin family protein [Carboxylicivirga linearis]|uniref:Thioredoxin family protein n=1 Tax=Carboxylicivirga linearis TaxID=1628157 RepID=A0ABS5JRT8_9BACT|nr:thioredoxin family protein [Carboxylicivirga linearis]MBS2097535.1 thioredoxin family protein [Carboxylicivirga linearis]
MKTIYLTMVLVALSLVSTAQVKVGDNAPDFKLLNTDGEMVALSDYNKEDGVILVFTCNHCPYAKLYEQRIIDLNKKYKSKKYPVVAINPNDSVAYKVDGYSYMVDKQYDFPYLLDNKGIFSEYGATKTPHIFLLKNSGDQFEVAYIGAIDDNPQDASEVKEKYLELAIQSLMEGKTPKYTSTKAIGCSIKPFK